MGALEQLILAGDLGKVKAYIDDQVKCGCIVDLMEWNAFSASTPLHAMAAVNTGSDDYNVELIHDIVSQIMLHPGNFRVNWRQEDGRGLNFISIIDEVAEYSDATPTEPVMLLGEAWEWDLLELGDSSEVLKMQKEELLHKCNRATGIFWKLCQAPCPDVNKMRQMVAKECPDPMHQCGAWEGRPLLSQLLWCKGIGVEVLLTSRGSIDFTVVDHYGRTPLHYMTCLHAYPVRVRRVLRLIIDHVNSHPSDVIDWGLEDSEGNDPLSSANEADLLPVWIQVVRHDCPVPYYVNARRLIISTEVLRKDMRKLIVQKVTFFSCGPFSTHNRDVLGLLLFPSIVVVACFKTGMRRSMDLWRGTPNATSINKAAETVNKTSAKKATAKEESKPHPYCC
eukprot:gene10604-7368_t